MLPAFSSATQLAAITLARVGAADACGAGRDHAVPAQPADLARVVIVGTSGAGKTTFAEALAAVLGGTAQDLDPLFWGPDWTPKPAQVFRQLVAQAIAGERWVVAGNYADVRGLIWSRASCVIWLNYSFTVVLWRSLKRTLYRASTRKPLWHGNAESFRRSFFSRDSILLWVLTTYARRRRNYAALRAAGEFAQLRWIEFRHPREAQQFLQALRDAAPGQPAGAGMSALLPVTGGCLCGAIRYTCASPLGPANYCHCADCRRVTGSAFNIGIRVDVANLQVAGSPSAFVHAGGSGQPVTRQFCGDCGSPLFTLHPARPESIWLRAGTLDNPDLVRPAYEAWTSSKVPWAHPSADLIRYSRNRQ